MTHPARPATWADIEQFCRIDGWKLDRSSDHVFWEKVLPTGEVLQTHRSFAENKSLSQDLFSLVLREQLKVDRATFWCVLQTGEPAIRPTNVEKASPEYEAWVICGLIKCGLREEEIREMTPSNAKALLLEKWSSPSS